MLSHLFDTSPIRSLQLSKDWIINLDSSLANTTNKNLHLHHQQHYFVLFIKILKWGRHRPLALSFHQEVDFLFFKNNP